MLETEKDVNSVEPIIKNLSGIEIMSSDGKFKPFWGLIEKKSHGYKIELENGITKSYSDGHKFVTDGVEFQVETLKVGDYLCGSKIKSIVDTEGTFYGPYDVQDHEYATVDEEGRMIQGNHNCEFQGSSSTLVPLDKLSRCVPSEPASYKYGYTCSIWEEPQPGFVYVMGVDTASGSGLDFSAIQILKLISKDKFEQVCVYHNDRITAGKFSVICKDLSNWYNDAEIVIENNGPGGKVAEEMWYTLDCQNIINTDPKGIGTNANRASKLDACLLLQKLMENDNLILHDASTIKELTSFIEVSPNVFKGEVGSHDDLVSALYWATYATSQPEIDLDNLTIDKNRRGDDVEVPQTVFPDDDEGVWSF